MNSGNVNLSGDRKIQFVCISCDGISKLQVIDLSEHDEMLD